MPTPGLPPGPRWPALFQTLATTFAFERFARFCMRRFGGVVTLRFLGFGPMVVVSDPTLIREVFTGDRDVLAAGAANAQLSAVIGRGSVMLLDGERHLRRRRLLLPPFHGDAVRGYTQAVAQITSAAVRDWPRGREFPTLPHMKSLTLDVILRTVIGVQDEERAARLRPLLASIGASIVGIAAESGRPGLSEGRLARWLPWVRERKAVQNALDEEIAAHRRDPEGRTDVLALLIAARDEDGRPLADADLRGELLALLLAGHDTTATALAWCFERLVRHPGVLARLEAEIAGPDGHDTYVDAVISETFRCRPVVDSAQRMLTTELALGGHLLPAGTRVAPAIWGVQHSEAFDDPYEFRPERFLEGPAPRYTLIPFGGGVRRCIGASFAEMEMRTVLRTVLTEVALQPSGSRDEKAKHFRAVTTAPARGARVVIRDR